MDDVDVDEVMRKTKRQIEKGVKYVKGTAKSITADSYACEADNTRSKQQRRRMKAGRRRNFANKMDIIDPHYGRKAAAVLAGGTVLGLAATTCPGVGAALGPAVGGAVIAGGLAKLEHDAHKAVGDHATLDTLLDDCSDDWKSQHPKQATDGGFEQERQEWLDEVLGYEDDDDDDEYYDYDYSDGRRDSEDTAQGAPAHTSLPGEAMGAAVALAREQAREQAREPQGDLLDLLGVEDAPQSAATASSMDLFARDAPASAAVHSSLLDAPPPSATSSAAAAAAVPDDDPFAALAAGRPAEAPPSSDFDFFSNAPASATSSGAAAQPSLFDAKPLTPSPASVPPPASRYDAFKT